MALEAAPEPFLTRDERARVKVALLGLIKECCGREMSQIESVRAGTTAGAGAAKVLLMLWGSE